MFPSYMIFYVSFSGTASLFDHCGQIHDRAYSPTKHGEESLSFVTGTKVNLDGAMSKTFRTVLVL